MKEHTSLKGDLGADSLDMTELAIALEEEFDVEIPDGSMDSIQTVGDIYKTIFKLKNKNNF